MNHLTGPNGGTLHGLTHEQRFWMKVEITATCWLWKASTKNGGYGQFVLNGSNHAAHRISWEFHHGPIPDDMHVCHHCDRPPCVRPDHLFLGDRKANMSDCALKGRHRHFEARGEHHPSAKLSADQVAEIIDMRARGSIYREISDRFGISISQVARITRGESWQLPQTHRRALDKLTPPQLDTTAGAA